MTLNFWCGSGTDTATPPSGNIVINISILYYCVGCVYYAIILWLFRWHETRIQIRNGYKYRRACAVGLWMSGKTIACILLLLTLLFYIFNKSACMKIDVEIHMRTLNWPNQTIIKSNTLMWCVQRKWCVACGLDNNKSFVKTAIERRKLVDMFRIVYFVSIGLRKIEQFLLDQNDDWSCDSQ